MATMQYVCLYCSKLERVGKGASSPCTKELQ